MAMTTKQPQQPRQPKPTKTVAPAAKPPVADAPQPPGPAIDPAATETVARIGALRLLDAIAADLARNKDVGAYDLVAAAVDACGWEAAISGLGLRAQVELSAAVKRGGRPAGLRDMEAQARWEAVKAGLRVVAEALGS